MKRLSRKTVERNDPGNYRRQRCGNMRVARVGDIHLPVNLIVVDFSGEGGSHLARRSRKFYDHLAVVYLLDTKALAAQPLRDGLDVRGGGPIFCARLLRRQPSV